MSTHVLVGLHAKREPRKPLDPPALAANLPPTPNNRNLSHVPCKFYRQGSCQAGNNCPFSHNLDGQLAADKLPCKYFQMGNCKFGLKCALGHYLPDGTRINKPSRRRREKNRKAVPIDIDEPKPAWACNYKTEENPSPVLRSFGHPYRNVEWSHLPAKLFEVSPPTFPLVPLAYEETHEEATYSDDDGFYDYVPATLGSLILTPQECQKRELRLQLGTLLVRPPMDDVFLMEN